MKWVLVQGVLFGLLIFYPADRDFSLPGWFRAISFVATLVGILILARAIYDLRRSLAIEPTPRLDGELQQAGIYSYIRHPMYLAVWLLFTGAVLDAGSYVKLGFFALLVLFFVIKTNHEERLLLIKYPGYKQYMKKVGRFLPKVRLTKKFWKN